MKKARLLLASLAVLLIAPSCGGAQPGSIHESVAGWDSFSGAPVPAGATIYISSINSVGEGSTWLGESWFTRGHSHSGLFRSEDNGSTWRQMLGWDGWPLWQKYFNANDALIATEFEEGYRLHLRLLRTTDGGLHWSASDLPAGPFGGWSAQAIDFVDRNNGWLMISLGAAGDVACGQAKEAVAIYRTRNGGATWSEIIRVDQQHPSSHGLRLEAGKVGLSFRTVDSGYITTSDPTEGDLIYFTENGGDSWKPQPLPVNQGRGLAVIAPPDWITPTVGLMSVNISGRPLSACMLRSPSPQPQPSRTPEPWDVEGPANLVSPYPGPWLLATSDAGANWSVVAPSTVWGSVSSVTATDASHWFVGSADNLWLTTDGGQQWVVNKSVLRPGCSFGLLRFVDGRTGLGSALCEEPGPVIQGCPGGVDYISAWDCTPLATPLLATRDGGSHWFEVPKPALR